MPTTGATGDAAQRRRDPRTTYEAILEAALGAMAERGPEGLTVSEVAHRAGVNRTTAYQHFRTREQLIAAVIGRVLQEVKRILESEVPLGERIDQVVELHARRPDIARLWLFYLLSDAELPEDRPWQRFLESMRSLTASDSVHPGIDPEMLACILLGATLVWSLLAGRGSADEAGAREATARFARELKRLVASGVLKSEA
jgi:AcrR family transcriptional regulator